MVPPVDKIRVMSDGKVASFIRKEPAKAHHDDAGYDITVVEGGIVWPFTCKDFRSGWRIRLPEGVWGSMKARSSTLYKKKLMVLEGVFDPGYTGVLSVVVFNPTPIPRIVRAGDRLSQLVLVPTVDCRGVLRTIHGFIDYDTATRKDKGFGSTGE